MPAQVSGPGALSKRTDTGGQPIRSLPDPEYGEAQEYEAQQKGAPLAKSGKLGGSAEGGMPEFSEPGQPAAPPVDTQPLPGMFDEGDPGVPVTSGAPIGAGPNQIEGLPGGTGQPVNFRQSLEPYVLSDHTGILSEVVAALAERGQY